MLFFFRGREAIKCSGTFAADWKSKGFSYCNGDKSKNLLDAALKKKNKNKAKSENYLDIWFYLTRRV